MLIYIVKQAAGVMGLTMEEFNNLPDKKYWRTVLGKGSNFEISLWLANTAKAMGWGMEKTAEAVKATSILLVQVIDGL